MKLLYTRAIFCALLTLGLHAAPPPSLEDDPQDQRNKRSPRPSGVPRLIKYGGSFADGLGAPRVGTIGVRFAIYGERTGGAPLWQESQNVQLDGQGRYSVLLGASRELSAEIFSTNEARWLGVQVLADAEPEQSRVLLVSVPYALKSQDAETLGGRPASAYVLNETLSGSATGSGIKSTGGQAPGVNPEGTVQTTAAHTVDAIPKFSATDTLADSLMMELYTQPAIDAFGLPLGFNEDVVRLGNGTGLRKALHIIGGRVKAEGFDVSTSLPNAVRATSNAAFGTTFQTNNTYTGTNFTTGVFTSVQSSNAVGFQSVVFAPITPSVPGADYTYSMVGVNYNPEGVSVLGWHRYDAGAGDPLPSLTGPVGVFGSVAHSSGTAGIFAYRGTGTGKIFSGLAGTSEVIAMTSEGDLTAAGDIAAVGTITATGGFSGSGAGLTGVSASTVACTGCIGISELAFDPATQAELDAHKISGDHDGRYAQLGAANAFSMAQTINADLTLTGSINAGFRVIADPTSPNVIGGHSGNAVTAGYGAAIGGGSTNQVTGNFGVVAGGEGNTAGDHAVVSGGYNNTAGESAFIGGGSVNSAGGSLAVVGGGTSNTASGSLATVPGGWDNTAAGLASFAAGWRANAAHDFSFVWSDGSAISTSATQQFLVQSTGGVRILSGFLSDGGGLTIEPTFSTPNMILGFRPYLGGGNAATSGVIGATISGGGHSGLGGPNRVTDNFGTVGGGVGNRAGDNAGDTTGTPYATVGGGFGNTASGTHSGILSGRSNTALGSYASVVGGEVNQASGEQSFVGGGSSNNAGGPISTIAGGIGNSGSGTYSFIGGGFNNVASGSVSVIAGGGANLTSAEGAAVGGGLYNQATSTYATIPGGFENTASGQNSFAAGRRAKAIHDGSFVWADLTASDATSSASNEFTIRAGGGFRLLDSGNTQVFGISASGAVTATSFIGDGSGLTGTSSSNVNCTGCVSASEVDFNYAGSAAQGGSATDALQLGGVAAANYARLDSGNSFVGNQGIAGDLSATGKLSVGATVGGIAGSSTATFSNASSGVHSVVYISRALGSGSALTVENTGGNGPAIYATSDDANNASIRAGVGANGGTAIRADVNSPVASIGIYGSVVGNLGSIPGVFAAINGQQILSGRRGTDVDDEVFRVNEYGNVGLVGPYPGVSFFSLDPGTKVAALQTNAGGTVLQFEDAGTFALQALDRTNLSSPEGKVGTNVFTVDASGNAVASGSVTATSFIGNGSGLTGVSTTVANGSITLAKLAFDPATQAELDTHKTSSDHDASYVLKAGDTMTGALSLPSNGLVAGTDQLVLASGNVGIGTTTPNMKLRIDNSANQGGLYLTQTNTLSSLPALNVYAEGVSTQNALIVESRVGGVDPYIVGLAVKTDGNVGIGTTSPTSKLDVVGYVRAQALIAQSTGKLVLGGYDNGLGGGTGVEFNAVEEGYDFKTYNGGWASRMVITDAGRVGIGTTSPAQALDVLGNILASGSVTASSFTGSLTGTASNASSLGSVAAANYARLDVGTNQTFTGSQTMPMLALPATSSSTAGVITSGGSRFLHRYGMENTFLGLSAGNFALTGIRNTGLGEAALSSVTSGNSNTAVGSYALNSLTSNGANTAVGAFALYANTIGGANTALGSSALESNTQGLSNTAAGTSALFSNTTGSYNTGSGVFALFSNTSGTANTAGGREAMYSNTTGNYNLAQGFWALFSNTVGTQNTAAGVNALYGNTSGANNTAVGFSAGAPSSSFLHNTTGSNNTFVGYFAGPGTATQLTNATAIGANALVSADNSLVLGDAAVNVGIGTQTPTQKLDVVGNILASGSVTAASFSGSGAALTGVAAADLACAGCVAGAELAFDPATQAELDTHKTSSDHDTRYVLKAGDTMTGALVLPANGLTAGANQLVLASGNVGVGMVPSGYALDVAGQLRSSSDMVIGPGTNKTLWFNRNEATTHTRAKLGFVFDGTTNNLDMAAIDYGVGLEERARVRVSQGNYVSFDTNMVERARIDSAGNFGIGTTTPTAKLHVVGATRSAGIIESTSGGFKFPDGSTQTSAASPGELIVVTEETFDEGQLPTTAFTSSTTGAGTVTVTGGQLLLQTGAGGADSATVQGTKQFAIGTGTLVFKGRIAAYHDGTIYGNFQPRGLANGTDRNNAIEFISASPTSVKARTVAGGVATETTAAIGETIYSFGGPYYQIVATSSQVKFYVNGALVATHTTNIPTTPLNILLTTSDGGTGNTPLYVSNVSFMRRE